MFRKEIHVWSKLLHHNVLPLLGFAICDDTKYPLLISEWMYNGSAWSYVHYRPELANRDRVLLVCLTKSKNCAALKKESRFVMWQEASHICMRKGSCILTLKR